MNINFLDKYINIREKAANSSQFGEQTGDSFDEKLLQQHFVER